MRAMEPTARTAKMCIRDSLYGAATTLEIDSAARISLPEHDRKKAHLDREVTVVGGDDRLVIWDRETYAARQAETEDILAGFFD